jgi:hypothetical protein
MDLINQAARKRASLSSPPPSQEEMPDLPAAPEPAQRPDKINFPFAADFDCAPKGAAAQVSKPGPGGGQNDDGRKVMLEEVRVGLMDRCATQSPEGCIRSAPGEGASGDNAPGPGPRLTGWESTVRAPAITASARGPHSSRWRWFARAAEGGHDAVCGGDFTVRGHGHVDEDKGQGTAPRRAFARGLRVAFHINDKGDPP